MGARVPKRLPHNPPMQRTKGFAVCDLRGHLRLRSLPEVLARPLAADWQHVARPLVLRSFSEPPR